MEKLKALKADERQKAKQDPGTAPGEAEKEHGGDETSANRREDTDGSEFEEQSSGESDDEEYTEDFDDFEG
ncbi:MAG: hypothetical protein L6R39_002854 [Caloplaca ligustica]|nr:MAG: hypothetical protein L6R39_002854 [Caloplaca ligustica]